MGGAAGLPGTAAPVAGQCLPATRAWPEPQGERAAQVSPFGATMRGSTVCTRLGAVAARLCVSRPRAAGVARVVREQATAAPRSAGASANL